MRGTVITPHYHRINSQLVLTRTIAPVLQLLSIGAHTMAGLDRTDGHRTTVAEAFRIGQDV
jgi:hypothetical protein